MSIYTRIAGTGSYTPSTALTNRDLMNYVDTDDAWITTRTGIKSRRIVTDEGTTDLAVKASQRALDNAGVPAKDIDLIIVATVTPDHHFPSTSNLLQARLGLPEVMTFDLNAACSGFLYALNLADKMIKSGAHQHALIVGAETLSRLTDWRDRNTCVLFGDAAGAMVISRSDDDHIHDAFCGSRGDIEGVLHARNVELKDPAVNARSQQDHIHMKGADVFRFATRIVPDIVTQLLTRNQCQLDDIDQIVAHQANKRIIEKAARTLGVPLDKMFMNIQHYGNTSAASVPLAIDEAIRSGALHRGDRFITVAFGGGLTWGGALITL